MTRAMLAGLREIERAHRYAAGGRVPAGRRMRRVWWQLYGHTREALVRHGLVEPFKREDAGVQWNELRITTLGWGVLMGAAVVDPVYRRRSA